MFSIRKKIFNQSLIFAIISLILIFSIPPGNYPVDDDFIYYQTVGWWLNGNFKLQWHITSTFIFQAMYGTFLSKIFGYSHLTLMLSTMVLAWLTAIVYYSFLKQNLSSSLAPYGAMLLLLNPVFFLLAHSFMTDIPAMFFTLLALKLYVDGLFRDNSKKLFLASLATSAGFLIRQFTACLILPVALFLYKKREDNANNTFPISLALPLLTISIWGIWYFFVYHNVAPNQLLSPTKLIIYIPYNLLKFLSYLALWLFPLGLGTLFNFNKLKKEKNCRIILLLTLVVLILPLSKILRGKSPLLPYGGVIIAHNWLGPAFMAGIKPGFLPSFFWSIATLLMLPTLYLFFRGILRSWRKEIYKFFFLTLLSFLAPTLLTIGFDRYFFFLFPFALPFFIYGMKDLRYHNFWFVLCIVILGIWSLLGVYDHHSWNLARWQAIDYLKKHGAHPKEIDAGWEYLLAFSEEVHKHGNQLFPFSDRYVVSFSYPPVSEPGIPNINLNYTSNYTILAEFPYFTPLGKRAGIIYALEKSS